MAPFYEDIVRLQSTLTNIKTQNQSRMKGFMLKFICFCNLDIHKESFNTRKSYCSGNGTEYVSLENADNVDNATLNDTRRGFVILAASHYCLHNQLKLNNSIEF